MNKRYFALIAQVIGYTTIGTEVLKMASEKKISNECRDELLEVAKYLSLQASRAEADMKDIEDKIQYLKNVN